MPITKEQIITAMQAAARELGHTPTRAEFSRLSGIPIYDREKAFFQVSGRSERLWACAGGQHATH